ncbi:HNH endonuclease [Lacinutrix sp. MedPE-SW]|uniref:HNH endonuclease n=1 Tax=Lacinutrix sp. MedPE-SW TaxID=1860087 RepID=UPI000917619A|nr:HNH endonuclease [Lacinutrix sp. MedPE-SW]OIQ24115.1 MAG: hypothetical protein BM549_02065 [Lacinutrix sp. MedPE-SW]
MFTYKDIQWVRNVKRDGGDTWAYFDIDNDEMILHWSSSYVNQPTHAMKPKIGDIVVLFQKINSDGKVYFTHLLTPIDNIELDCIKTNPKYRWGRKMKVLAKTKKLGKPSNFNLKAVNQGHTYSVDLLDNSLKKNTIQKILWNAFIPFFNEDAYQKYISQLTNYIEDDEIDSSGSSEGKINYILHKLRERNNKLVREKKASVINPTCECCNFDFSNTYPNLGNGFIECHHKIPINQGERITKLEDLALVCANCHRMLHRKNKENEYYTVEQLKQIIINE